MEKHNLLILEKKIVLIKRILFFDDFSVLTEKIQFLMIKILESHDFVGMVHISGLNSFS